MRKLLLTLVLLAACAPADAASVDRLVITSGGTPSNPKVYSGNGAHVDGITIEADHVVVEGYVADRPSAPGIEIWGSDVTVRDVTVTSPRGGDGDGIRFFGDDIRILSNTIRGTSNSDGRHADCMQTYSDDSPPSNRVLIEGTTRSGWRSGRPGLGFPGTG